MPVLCCRPACAKERSTQAVCARQGHAVPARLTSFKLPLQWGLFEKESSIEIGSVKNMAWYIFPLKPTKSREISFRAFSPAMLLVGSLVAEMPLDRTHTTTAVCCTQVTSLATHVNIRTYTPVCTKHRPFRCFALRARGGSGFFHAPRIYSKPLTIPLGPHPRQAWSTAVIRSPERGGGHARPSLQVEVTSQPSATENR